MSPMIPDGSGTPLEAASTEGSFKEEAEGEGSFFLDDVRREVEDLKVLSSISYSRGVIRRGLPRRPAQTSARIDGGMPDLTCAYRCHI
eukprot:1055826-Amorphochlora_amoeboformis.AAC.1